MGGWGRQRGGLLEVAAAPLSGFLLFHGLNQPPARAAAATPHAALRMKPARSDWLLLISGSPPSPPRSLLIPFPSPTPHPLLGPRPAPPQSSLIGRPGQARPRSLLLPSFPLPPPLPPLSLLAHEGTDCDCSLYTSLFVTSPGGGGEK